MNIPPAQYEFLRKLHFIRFASLGISGFVVARCLRSPKSVVEVLLLFAIAICVGQLVAHLILKVGFWIWLKKFGSK